VTAVGVAVAVTDTAPADAVALIGFQIAGDTANHNGIPTSSGEAGGGLNARVGEGGFSWW